MGEKGGCFVAGGFKLSALGGLGVAGVEVGVGAGGLELGGFWLAGFFEWSFSWLFLLFLPFSLSLFPLSHLLLFQLAWLIIRGWLRGVRGDGGLGGRNGKGGGAGWGFV